jgi:tryptophan synthase alpha subunit
LDSASQKANTQKPSSTEADGVVVGSAYAKIYAKNLQNPIVTLLEIAKLSREIKAGYIKQYPNKN